MTIVDSAPWAVWNRARIQQAAHQWATTHGRPPGATDWRKATPDHPNESNVRRIYGTWNQMIEACGWEPRGAHRPRTWTRQDCIKALFEWTYEHGRNPRWDDWAEPGSGRPTSRQTIALYGSWNAMLVAAGYQPRVMYRTVKGYAMQAGALSKKRTSEGTFA